MSTQIGSLPGNDDVVAHTIWYVTMAARAAIGLGGLVGLQKPHLDIIEPTGASVDHSLTFLDGAGTQPTKAHSSNTIAAATAATTKT